MGKILVLACPSEYTDAMKATADSVASTTARWAEIRELPLSARIQGLHERFLQRYAELGRRIYTEDADVQARDEALLAAYVATVGQPPILRRARALAEFARRIPLRGAPDDLLLGQQTFNAGFAPTVREQLTALGYASTTGHIVHDYGGLVAQGIPGLRAQLQQTGTSETLNGFSQALEAFATYIRRHADNGAADRAADLFALCEAPPCTFAQALQLVWFAQIFLHAENPSAAISFGRIDQYLWPFLRDDLQHGRLDLPGAFEWVCAFLIKCCEGEESQNVVLGGVDAAGDDAANPLSLLFLAAMRRLKTFQPSLSVRIHPGMWDDFFTAACELAAAGTGNPGFMNDPVVIRGLQALEISLDRARDWGIVGCYEATPQGDAYPNTVLGRLHLVHALADYVQLETTQALGSFADVLSGWYRFIQQRYTEETLPRCQASWDHFRDQAPSPFGSLLMRDCLERALPLEAGGARFNMVGINILGLGTLVDSLHAIREMVFHRREISLPELAAALSDNFADDTLRERLRRLEHRYGTDSEATNTLAREVSTHLARMVLDSRMEHGVRPYPGFFAFSGDIYALGMASPDGRRADDLLSYGVAPSSTVDTSLTAMLTSAAQVSHALAACGNPLSVTLQRSDVQGAQGCALIRQIVETYFRLGGSHLHINLMDAGDLRRAQADPLNHAAVTVRVSGYSARFVTVDARWQDALIERAERGM